MPPPPLPPSAPTRKDKGKEKAKEKWIPAVSASGSCMLPPPTGNKAKAKAGGGRKRKRNDDDAAYQDRYDPTAEKLVQQVMCPSYAHRNRADVSNSRRHGYKPYESTRPSSSFTPTIMSSYVCAIGPLGHSTSRTSSSLTQIGIYVAAIQDAMDRQKQQLDNTA